MNGRVRGWACVVLAAAAVGVAGCSSGAPAAEAPAPAGSPVAEPPAGSASGGSGSPEDQRTSAQSVAGGLRGIQGVAGQVAALAGSDKTRATQLDEQIEPQWRQIEGTVKANDQNAYLSFEDAFAALEDAAKAGDGAKATQASGAVGAASGQYLARYPG